MEQVEWRELAERLDDLIPRVKAGETFELVEDGVPFARIVPIDSAESGAGVES